jgi:hypothetical protein
MERNQLQLGFVVLIEFTSFMLTDVAWLHFWTIV